MRMTKHFPDTRLQLKALVRLEASLRPSEDGSAEDDSPDRDDGWRRGVSNGHRAGRGRA